MKRWFRIQPAIPALYYLAAGLIVFSTGEAKSQADVNAGSEASVSIAAPAGKPTTLLIALEEFSQTRKIPNDNGLLVVNPAKAMPGLQGASPPAISEEAADSLAAIAQNFGRIVIASGPVTAMVPPQMVLTNPNPGMPNIFQDLSAATKMRLLMDTLTPAQWGQLGGANGLGTDALSDKQSLLFLSLLPDPFCIRRVTVEQGEYKWEDAEAHVLPPEMRSKTRLRLNLASEIRPIPSELGQGITLLGDTAHRQGTTFLTLDGSANVEQSAGRAGQGTYGVLLHGEMMNAPKPSELDFDLPALAARVALKPDAVSDKGLTVGEVVRRAGMASHLELYADRRIGSLPVWYYGASAPARDLLRALCLSVTGTFRKVGPAFVLTDDVVGIGTRLAAQQDWLEEAKAQQEEMLETLQAYPLSKPLLMSLSFPPNDPLAADGATVAKILAGYGQVYSGDYQVALSGHLASQQAVFQERIDDALKQEQPVRTDAVALNINLRMAYLVPGEGEVTPLQTDLGSLLGFIQPPASDLIRVVPPIAALLKPISLAAFPDSNLCVEPKSDSEAVRAVDEAKKGGFKKLWVRLPADASTSPLVAAVAQGKKRKVAVTAVISLFRQPAGLLDADQNVQGQTSSAYDAALLRSTAGRRGQKLPFEVSADNWEQISAASLDDQQKRLTKLANIPGLAGIVLRDTAAPGYETITPQHGQDLSPLSHLPGSASHDMGYTVGLRLAFLRRYGLDPIDVMLPQTTPTDNGSLPFFPADAQGVQQWVAFRGEINARHMAALFASIRGLNIRLPLMIGERSGGTAWFNSWDTPQALPLYDPGPLGKPADLQARSVSSRVLKNIAVTDGNMSQADYRQYIQNLLPTHGTEKHWDGVVFDFSALPVDKAFQLTEDCFKQTVPGKP